jgi:hypothetical protein
MVHWSPIQDLIQLDVIVKLYIFLVTMLCCFVALQLLKLMMMVVIVNLYTIAS